MILHTYPILDLLDKDWLSCSTQIMYTVIFNGRTARQLHPEKGTYQPDMLRKVHVLWLKCLHQVQWLLHASLYPLQLQGECKLGNANVMLEDRIPTAPQQLLNTLSLQLPTDLSLDDMVNVYGGVTSQQRQMVKTGEFIAITSDFAQVRSTTYLFFCPCHTNICSPIIVYPFGSKY